MAQKSIFSYFVDDAPYFESILFVVNAFRTHTPGNRQVAELIVIIMAWHTCLLTFSYGIGMPAVLTIFLGGLLMCLVSCPL